MTENNLQNSEHGELDATNTHTPVSEEQAEQADTTENNKSQDIQKVAQETTQAVAKGVSSAFESATAAVAEGFQATKEVHEAARETNNAKQQLKQLEENLAKDKEDLEHRDHVRDSYDDIITEQQSIINDAAKVMSEQSTQVDLLTVKKNQLIQKLEQQKVDDEAKIKPYKEVAATAKGRLDDISKTISEAQRGVKNAEAQLKEVTEKRDAAVASARKALENSQARQLSLREEIAGLKTDPAANHDAIIRLEEDLKSELARSEEAKKQSDEIQNSFQSSLEMAQTHYWTQSKSLEYSESSIDAARADYEQKQQEYDAVVAESNARQRILSKDIETLEEEIKAAKELFNEAADKHDAAQTIIDDAKEIYATPEITEQLRKSVDEQIINVNAKKHTLKSLIRGEKILREATRGQRIGFIAVVIGMIVILALFVWLIFNRP